MHDFRQCSFERFLSLSKYPYNNYLRLSTLSLYRVSEQKTSVNCDSSCSLLKATLVKTEIKSSLRKANIETKNMYFRH
jgi:hypothetical protein